MNFSTIETQTILAALEVAAEVYRRDARSNHETPIVAEEFFGRAHKCEAIIALINRRPERTDPTKGGRP
jgi:hypothetical protein